MNTPRGDSKYLGSGLKADLLQCVFLDQLSNDSCGASGGLRGHRGAHADGCLRECATLFLLLSFYFKLQEPAHPFWLNISLSSFDTIHNSSWR